MSSEAVFRVLQLGVQSSVGTAVAATEIYPCEPGSGEFQLDRGIFSPDEDYGVIARHQAGRGSNGIRLATGDLTSTARYEDIGKLIGMTVGSAVNDGTVDTFTADQTSSTFNYYTVEVKEDVLDWIVTGVSCTSLELGFDALTAPGNAPWMATASLQAIDKAAGTATASLTAPSPLETIEGQFTSVYQGPAGTAFASLPELEDHLVSYSISITDPKPPRPYADEDAGDLVPDFGRQKREIEVTMQLKESTDSLAATWDIFNVAGAFPTDRRWRVQTNGSGSKRMTIDHLLRFTDVQIEPDGRDGERLITVTAYAVNDSTLASDLQMVVRPA